MKKTFLTLAGILFLMNCGGDEATSTNDAAQESQSTEQSQSEEPVAEASEEVSQGEDLAKKGEELFTSKACVACHKMDTKVIGPALGDVTSRRSDDFILSMMKDPTNFVKTDPEAKKLFEEYNKTPMTNNNLTDDEANALLAYLKTQKK